MGSRPLSVVSRQLFPGVVSSHLFFSEAALEQASVSQDMGCARLANVLSLADGS